MDQAAHPINSPRLFPLSHDVKSCTQQPAPPRMEKTALHLSVQA